jgi:hypothetical protein
MACIHQLMDRIEKEPFMLFRKLAAGLAGIGLLGGASPPPVRLVSPDTHNRLLGFFPATDNDFLAGLKDQPLIFYDETVMPQAYQHDEGVHSPAYNISADKPAEPFGNPNREFPWNKTAGLDNCPTASTVLFMSLPPGEAIRWWSSPLAHDGGAHTVQWLYPAGTIFGELLLQQGPDGYSYTFEVRARTKQSDGGWKPNVFRPYRSPVELAEQIRRLGGPSNGALNAGALAEAIEGGRVARPALLQNHHPVRVFSRWSFADPLPPLDAETVKAVLREPFRSVMGQTWLQAEEGTECFAPTSAAEFGVVPKGYAAAAMRVSTKACMACHETTLMDASELQPARSWYGMVRGSDGIFSMHIFEPSCISGNGYTQRPELRRSFLAAGILKHWDEP